MILEIKEFRQRVKDGLPALVGELQAVTGRFGDEEKEAWGNSLPLLAKAFASPGFDPLHLYFNGTGALSLEYQLPAASSWCDVVLLGKKEGKPGAVIIELKHWLTHSDSPGAVEGLIQHFGQPTLHPSDQVRGYAEYCRRFHSAVHDFNASVSGCVLFTRDTITKAYRQKPNDVLTSEFPCFGLSDEDLAKPFPDFVARAVTEPDSDFAAAFETGTYKQDRGFVRQIGQQILDPKSSPFELLDNQRRAFALCRAQVNASVFGDAASPRKKVIVIDGPPGSGKSVVAAKIWAALSTDERLPDGPIVFTSTSSSQNSNWSHLFSLTAANIAGSGVVKKATSYTPITTHRLGQLRATHNNPNLFKEGASWREHMQTLRALGTPFLTGALDGEYLISVVDEAHALINPEHPEGAGQFGFVTGLGPQAFHIMRVSQVSIFLLDGEQSFRTRENTTVADIKKWAEELNAEYVDVSLAGSQFRCAGSKEYVDWVEVVLGGKSLETCRVLATAWFQKGRRIDTSNDAPTPGNVIAFPMLASVLAEDAVDYKVTPNPKCLPRSLEFTICDTPQIMEERLRERIAEGYTCRLLAPYARPWKTSEATIPHDLPPSMQDFAIEYDDAGSTKLWSKIWNFVPRQGADYATFIQGKEGSKIHADPLCEVGCPYAVRGFDWDYVGILWLSDLIHRRPIGLEVDLEHVHESGITGLVSRARNEADPQGPHHFNLRKAVAQYYRILLTRPIRGIYIWFEDKETRAFIENCLSL